MASHDHSDYVRGSQDITEQASTFSLVMTLTKWSALWIAALVLFLVIWFMPNGSFFGGLIAMVVVLVAGFFALRSKKTTH